MLRITQSLASRWHSLAILVGKFSMAASPLMGYEPVNEVPEDFRMPDPLPLEQSVASLASHPGLRVELVAAEPLVKDPINLDWGPDGKLWVVEMADYPLGIDGKGSPGGRVRFLEDRDADGRYDSSTVFLEGLAYPTSVRAWRNGVLVIACPEIIYAEDRDGDGSADHREVLYRGFREGNQQHRVNGLEWALDGSLVVANGDSGGTVESLLTGKAQDLGSLDLKIDPRTGGLELLTGRTQYGRVRDDFGNWFGSNNSRPFFHFSLNREIMARNPHVIYPRGARDIDGGTRDRQVFPLSSGGHRYNNPHSLNWITSACGMAIQRDSRLGESFLGNAFICEPVHNLVHRRRLLPSGSTFDAKRSPDELDSEFLASTDHWFRPTAARTGPDGGLWVVDMHRYVIEHPEWIPEPWQEVLDLRAGHERGRIYRVVSEECDSSAVPENLLELPIETLVARLESSNGTVRDRVHSLLQEARDPRSIPMIRRLATESPHSVSRIHSLYLLHELASWDGDLLLSFLDDPDPRALRHVVRIASRSDTLRSTLKPHLHRLAAIESLPLRQEIAIALGYYHDLPPGQLLGKLAITHAGDPTFIASAMTSLLPHLEAVTIAVTEAPGEAVAPLLPYLIETAVATDHMSALTSLLDAFPDDPRCRFQVYATLLTVVDRRRIAFDEFRASADETLAQALERTLRLVGMARTLVPDRDLPTKDRLGALTMLGRSKTLEAEDLALLLDLLHPSEPVALQQGAVRRLLEIGALSETLAHWKQLGPSVRSTFVTGCLPDRKRTAVLLTAFENGSIDPVDLDAASRERLLTYPQSQLRMQAQAVLGSASSPDRGAVMERFAPALELEGNPIRGRRHFQIHCAVCHQLDDVGNPIGPDLATLADKSPASLLAAVLDPNRAVEDKYRLYQAERRDGSVVAGMIESESGGSLVIRQLDGSSVELLRSELVSLKTEGRTAMPEGLERALDLQAMADLIALIQSFN